MENQDIYQLPLSGGDIATTSKTDAFKEATSSIAWVYKTPGAMFADTPIGPRVIQSTRFLYSTSATTLRRNANRLGIHVKN